MKKKKREEKGKRNRNKRQGKERQKKTKKAKLCIEETRDIMGSQKMFFNCTYILGSSSNCRWESFCIWNILINCSYLERVLGPAAVWLARPAGLSVSLAGRLQGVHQGYESYGSADP